MLEYLCPRLVRNNGVRTVWRVVDMPRTGDDSTIRLSVADLYCRVWREEPWNELDWTVEKVMLDMRTELGLLGAIGYAAAYDELAIGFTWGYPVDQAFMAKISGTNALDHLFMSGHSVFYIDELAVELAYRKLGVGEIITRVILSEIWRRGQNVIVLRTDDRAEEAIRLYRRLGFQEQNIYDAMYPRRKYWVL